MGFLDALLGRRKPVRPDLDQLFALPSAAVTLKSGGDLTPTGLGSVCFASVEGGAFDRLQRDVRGLLDSAEFSQDTYGYTWVLSRHAPDDIAALVNDLHAVNTFLQDAGFGPQLLCSLVGFRDDRDRSLALVYLYKRGTFYPVCIRSDQDKRDNARELRVAALLQDDLRIEPDRSRWFPVYGAPGTEV
jgi:hypothetical protein